MTKLFSLAPVLFLLSLMNISEAVPPVREVAPKTTYESAGMAPTATPYEFNQVVTPAPTPTEIPTPEPTVIPEEWQFYGQGVATYYAQGWGCWTGIIANQIRWGRLPTDFAGSPECYFAATINHDWIGRELRVTNIKDGRQIIVIQVDAVASHDIPSFLRKGAVIDISYLAAQAVGMNQQVLVEVKDE